MKATKRATGGGAGERQEGALGWLPWAGARRRPILRPEWWSRHIVGIDGHRLSTRLPAPTTARQVEEIFAEHLPRFIREHGDAPVPLVFWAHGGLIGRKFAFDDAMQAVPWWLANGIYPIYFVWDTGLMATFRAILVHRWKHALTVQRRRASASPGGSAEKTPPEEPLNDRLIDLVARLIDGRRLWETMKQNARDANFQDDGGGLCVASWLEDFLANHPGSVTLHAVGHSAGAVFQASFVRELTERGIQFDTLQLLAPAMSIRNFTGRLAPAIESMDVKSFTMFSMSRQTARSDHLLGLYRGGSMLYFVRNALEPEADKGMLGLQEDVAASALADYFDEDPDKGRISAIWSVAMASPRSSSAATTHAAFTTDVLTLDSVARRILGRDDIVSSGAFSGAFPNARAALLERIRRRF